MDLDVTMVLRKAGQPSGESTMPRDHEAYLYFEDHHPEHRRITGSQPGERQPRPNAPANPLMAEATRLGSEKLAILRIGGNRQVYVLIAKGEEGLARLCELHTSSTRREFLMALLRLTARLERGQTEAVYHTFRWSAEQLFDSLEGVLPRASEGFSAYTYVDISTLPRLDDEALEAIRPADTHEDSPRLSGSLARTPAIAAATAAGSTS